MNYLVIKEYKGKNFINQDIEIKTNTFVERIGDLIYFKGIPFCTFRSQVAKEHLIWNGDGNAKDREYYEAIILLIPRVKKWRERVPVYDDLDEKIGEKEIICTGRFSPNEIKYIKDEYSHLVENTAGLMFNDFFYCGSDIEDLRKLAAYLQR